MHIQIWCFFILKISMTWFFNLKWTHFEWIQMDPIEYCCQLKIGTCHLPLTRIASTMIASTRIKSLATAVADLQYTLKGVQVIRKEAFYGLGKTDRIGLQDS